MFRSPSSAEELAALLSALPWRGIGIALGTLLLLAAARSWIGRGRELKALRTQLHGARVRGGHTAEALAPLAEDFPVDVDREETTLVFLGQPVDYVYFDPEAGITFVEIKTGRSGLNDRQRRLRRAVEEGRVAWIEHRL